MQKVAAILGLALLLSNPVWADAPVRSAPAAIQQQPPAVLVTPGMTGERSVTVANRAPHSIVELYISPQSAESWGNDLLGEAVLDTAGQRFVRLGRMADCGFDLLAIYDDLSREEQRGVNLCRVHMAVFDGRHAVMPPEQAGPARSLVVIDASPMPIQQLFISPPDAAQWGDDLLASGSMSVGEQRTLTFHGPCAADVRVVFSNRAAEERRGLDLCLNPNLRVEPGWTTESRAGARD